MDANGEVRYLDQVTPGGLLLEEFLKPMEISQYRLAKEIGIPTQRIGEIIRGKRAITRDTDLRLSRFFGLSDGYWLRAQANLDLHLKKNEIFDQLRRLRPSTKNG